jgi:hypothetical protein
MYPDPFRPGQADDMDAAARREFFGPGGRRTSSGAPPIVAMHGNGLDTPLVPDATTDSPLNSDHRDTHRRPISEGLDSYGRRVTDDEA